MASELYPTVRVVNGIDLDNYFPERRCYNSVLYVHKKFLTVQDQKVKESKDKLDRAAKKATKKNTKKKKKGKVTLDKSQQFNGEENDLWKDSKTYKIRLSNDSVLEQTIKFAKHIVPLVIPPSRNVSPPPVFYTIKAAQKSKRKTPKARDRSENTQDVTYKKERSKRVIETFVNDKISQRESISLKETVSFGSQNNTLDEIHINPSLCCSLSEISEKKHHKRERSNKKCKQNDLLKLGASESFEALATELVKQSGDAKVKIHLMNETDKNLFSENIRIPILNAIKECIFELNNNNNVNDDLVTAQRYIKCNTEKLDNILEKLTCIEKKLEKHIKENVKPKSPEVQLPQASKLETRRQDLLEIKEASSEEECYEEDLCERKRFRSKSTVVQISPRHGTENVEKFEKKGLGCGEDGSRPLHASSQLGSRPDRPNRVPARFCWSDAAKKN